MPLFGKKKEPEIEQTSYEIFGGITITKNSAGYEIKWKNPIPSTIIVSPKPLIDANIKTSQEGDITRILTTECKLTITKRDGITEAKISPLWNLGS
ncbi:MAG: hypothetical protein QXI71_05985 [Candidatus Bathyarchaeia archaeon]|nr:hypothetical protein [Candidatus Bathyarchaeota archaeon]